MASAEDMGEFLVNRDSKNALTIELRNKDVVIHITRVRLYKEEDIWYLNVFLHRIDGLSLSSSGLLGKLFTHRANHNR